MKYKLFLSGMSAIVLLLVMGVAPLGHSVYAVDEGNGDNNNCQVDQNDNDDGVDAGADDDTGDNDADEGCESN
ncbi:MAG TPA: hypothetical protein VGR54_07025 [Nitrosopumilaceae archaeon]|nr:hypothetical protein [Nitrosopumilaceae archaeon]